MAESNLRVLIVDDVPMTRQYVKTALKHLGVSLVDIVGTAKETLEIFEAKRHDVVLLDIELPDGSGLEVLEKIKSLEEKTKVIMISGSSTPDNVTTAVKSGAAGFIAKPFSPMNIKDALIKALKK